MPICVSEPIGLGHAALDELDAGDERRGDGAEADGEDAEAAVGGGDGGGGGGVTPRGYAAWSLPHQ